MPAKKFATVAFVVVLLAIERFAYYATRPMLFVWLGQEHQFPMRNAGVLVGELSLVTLLVPIVGGLVAIAVGPRVVAVAGATLAAVGYIVLSAGADVGWFVALAGGGVGLLKPCTWAIAADELARPEVAAGVDPETVPPNPRRFARVGAMFSLMYLALNVGAGAAPVVASALANFGNVRWVFVMSSAAMTVVVVLAAALVALSPHRPSRVAAEPLPPQPVYRVGAAPTGHHAGAATATGVAALVILLGAGIPNGVVSTIALDPAEILRGAPDRTWIFWFLPMVVSLSAAVACVVLRAVRFGSERPALATALGGALAAGTVGAAACAAGNASKMIAAYLVGVVLLGAAEPIAAVTTTTYAALATTARWRTFAVAAFSALVTLPTYGVGAVEGPAVRGALLAFLGLVTLVGAAGFLCFGRRFHERFFASSLEQ
jgi:MFS family permease